MNTSQQNMPQILVVDGDNNQRLETCALVLKEGFQVLESRDGASALNLAQSHQPALILLNYKLSDGDGYQLCERLRAHMSVAETLILMLVPNENDAVEQAYDTGADDVLTLPAHPRLLRMRMRAMVNSLRQQIQLVQTERRAQQIFHENRAIMLMIDPHTGQIVDANRAASAFYGYRREDMLTKVFSDLDAPAEGEQHALKTTNLVMRHRLANGEIRDVTIFAGPVEIDGRKHVCMIVHDITKRKLAEVAEHSQRTWANALRETAASLVGTLDQEEVLDRIFSAMNQIIGFQGASIMAVDGDITYMVRLSGYADQGTEDTIVRDLRLPIAGTYTLSSVIDTNQPLIIADVRKEPRWHIIKGLEWVRSHVTAPIRLNQRIIGFLNVDSPVPDVYTETDAERLQAFADQAAIAINNAQMYRRLADQAADLDVLVRERTSELEHERAQLTAILDTMTEGVLYNEWIGGKMRVRFVNTALTRLTEYTEDEWLTESPAIFRQRDERGLAFGKALQPILDGLLARGRWQGEMQVPRKDGTHFLAHISSARLQRSDGQVFGAVAVVRDISQEKALAEQKSRFVAHASHELRTPLTNVKTRLYLLKKQPEKAHEHLAVLENVTDRMRRLVEDLLDLSRFERGTLEIRPRETDLTRLLHNVARLQQTEAEHKGLALRLEMPDAPIKAWVDPERLTQVFTNLIVNAINYTELGGLVTIRLKWVACETPSGECALIEVQDTGIGIAPENLNNVFQPFFRVPSDIQGTGLGLSIAREIVLLHHGDLTVDSILGEGSIFRVVLPLIIHEPESEAMTEANP